jgi:hypothetical protein
MDLPTCPACGQSILEDDVDECPFCGASMPKKVATKRKSSGKAVAKNNSGSTKTKVASQEPAPAASAARPSLRSMAARDGGNLDLEDNPFDIDYAAIKKKVIPVAKKRDKDRRYRVTCPMCETVGFVSPRAAGRDVQCANSECLVPIFTAPRPEKKKSTAPTDGKSGWSPMQKFFTAAIVMIVLAGGVSAVMLLTANPKPEQARIPPGPEPPGPEGPGIEHPPGPEPPTPPTEVVLTPQELLDQILPQLQQWAILNDNNRSKAFCRRLSAEACAIGGDLDRASDHLRALETFGRAVDYYRVSPLVAIAWAELEAGNTAAARTTIDEAVKAALNAPGSGRDRLDFNTDLAIILSATDRISPAVRLIDQTQDSGPLGQLSAYLFAACADESFNIDEQLVRGPALAWTAPQAVAVTKGLAARSSWNAALEWANDQPTEAAQIECLAAWSEAWATDAVRTSQLERLDRIDTISKGLSPVSRATVHARAALALALAEQNEPAQKQLKSARGALGEVTKPEPLSFPHLKQFFSFRLPDPIPLRLSAVAAAEISHVEALLGQQEAAWKSCETALGFLRAMAPSPSVIQERLDEARDRNVIGRQLKDAFGLQGNNVVDRKVTQYRKVCRALKEDANQRFTLRSELLSRAVEWKLLDEVWQEARSRAENSDAESREPYFDTEVPWLLVAAYASAGKDKESESIANVLKAAGKKPDARVTTRTESWNAAAIGNVKQAATHIKQHRSDKIWRHQLAMQLACRLAATGDVEPAVQFVLAIDRPGDQLLREDALELVVGMAAANGDGQKMWELLQDEADDLPATENIAICRGIVAGLMALPDTSASTTAIAIPAK